MTEDPQSAIKVATVSLLRNEQAQWTRLSVGVNYVVPKCTTGR